MSSWLPQKHDKPQGLKRFVAFPQAEAIMPGMDTKSCLHPAQILAAPGCIGVLRDPETEIIIEKLHWD